MSGEVRGLIREAVQKNEDVKGIKTGTNISPAWRGGGRHSGPFFY